MVQFRMIAKEIRKNKYEKLLMQWCILMNTFDFLERERGGRCVSQLG